MSADTNAVLSTFHPAIREWFSSCFSSPSDVQTQAWPKIAAGEHTLLAAPTGSGKTLAAFLACIDALVKEGVNKPLPDEARVLYVSPLKALSNDIQKNLQAPIQGVRDKLLEMGLADVDINAWVRTGDTPQSERVKATKKPPHIIVTTPESLYLLLTSKSGRKMLGTINTVIVDEIHAIAGNKRGAHLSLSLERLQALVGKKLTRVGCSATQNPIELIAGFLVGDRDETCHIVDTGHVRERDIALVTTESPLQAVMPNEVWQETYDALEQLVLEHKTTLIFVNTRRLAERAAKNLSERLGEEFVTSHHGSLSIEHRKLAETNLKTGKLKCLIATASLELGIDIGHVDLVCQLGTPRSISVFLQRVGRSGHSIGEIPKGRLFPLSRDDLVECTALVRAVNNNELDRLQICDAPLDVLSQQIVAEVAGREEWATAELYQYFKQAWPYKSLSESDFQKIIQMVADGFSTRRGRRAAYLHYDAINHKVRPRKGARLTAITNGGAIPDQFDYEVFMLPEAFRVGTLNEDFAFESMPGDIFQLGNTSYRILKVEQGKVFVEDARGEPPNLPFWLGEAPGRTDELSEAVSVLRTSVDVWLDQGMQHAVSKTKERYGLCESAAEQLISYLAATKAALGLIPNREQIIFERFFDETGDMHLVIHSPYGVRINRAWGLALRKKFCRQFNFELQAAALEDSIVLSLSVTHSFPIEEPAKYVKSSTARHTLVQALLDAPMFPTHWRWVASIALAIKRNYAGKRAPAPFQRNDAEDLVALLFPDQLACAENLTGRREVPDHPLVTQAINDCLHEVMDYDGFHELLLKIESGEVVITGRDLNAPSPMAAEILTARPYAFLDDAPAEERRTLAVQSRSFIDPASAADLGRLDPLAITRVRDEAWPEPVNADELHDALIILGFITEAEGLLGCRASESSAYDVGWLPLFEELQSSGRATQLQLQEHSIWVATERLHEFMGLYSHVSLKPEIAPLQTVIEDSEIGLQEIVRSRLEGLGPTTTQKIAATVELKESLVETALLNLEQQGFVVRGIFTQRESVNTQLETQNEVEWCERRLIARINRYTIKSLRKQIRPVSPARYMQFLLRWHALHQPRDGYDALMISLQQLEGCSIAAGAWEHEVLASRVANYGPELLDGACGSGQYSWMKLLAKAIPKKDFGKRKSTPVRNTPTSIIERLAVRHWRTFLPTIDTEQHALSAEASKVLAVIEERGASFFIDLVQHSGCLRTQVENALAELVNWGLVTSDNYAGLRALVRPFVKRPGYSGRRRGRPAEAGNLQFDRAGRWSLLDLEDADNREESVEYIAHTLLQRYGIVFRKVLSRETGLPPWRELLRVYWRMEARGEIRGGRFISSVAGEQFALPEAITGLRKIKADTSSQEQVVISATDPLNLVGIILPGDKITAAISNRILFINGVPSAVLIGDKLSLLEHASCKEISLEMRSALIRKHHGARKPRSSNVSWLK